MSHAHPHKLSFRGRFKLHKDANKGQTISESKELGDLPSSEPSTQVTSASVSDVIDKSADPPWMKLKKAAIVRDTTSAEHSASTSARESPNGGKDPTRSKPSMLMLSRETKQYRSIDDLSPEYGGLPFVKKLKILNERQKLEELESEIKKRSFSLDIPPDSQSG